MKRKDGIVLRSIGEASVLVPIGSRVVDLNCLVVLNETGRCVWNLLDGAHSLEDVAVALTERFEVKGDRARCDAVEFINQLNTMGLLDHADSAGG